MYAATVAVAATLEQRGLIAYDRGVVTIANPTRLERIACSCYGVVRRQRHPSSHDVPVVLNIVLEMMDLDRREASGPEVFALTRLCRAG